ncbi:hypothetical protein DL98DRAFT_29274 [Cadophora sp. DSE1049]|nr:hypothetical protein DL98DRAFT_29274 [Cadophora sp. DSE1049]
MALDDDGIFLYCDFYLRKKLQVPSGSLSLKREIPIKSIPRIQNPHEQASQTIKADPSTSRFIKPDFAHTQTLISKITSQSIQSQQLEWLYHHQPHSSQHHPSRTFSPPSKSPLPTPSSTRPSPPHSPARNRKQATTLPHRA